MQFTMLLSVCRSVTNQNMEPSQINVCLVWLTTASVDKGQPLVPHDVNMMVNMTVTFYTCSSSRNTERYNVYSVLFWSMQWVETKEQHVPGQMTQRQMLLTLNVLFSLTEWRGCVVASLVWVPRECVRELIFCFSFSSSFDFSSTQWWNLQTVNKRILCCSASLWYKHRDSIGVLCLQLRKSFNAICTT